MCLNKLGAEISILKTNFPSGRNQLNARKRKFASSPSALFLYSHLNISTLLVNIIKEESSLKNFLQLFLKIFEWQVHPDLHLSLCHNLWGSW
jgi:hypothetical protein